MFSQEITQRFIQIQNGGMVKKANGIGKFSREEGEEIKVYLKVEDGVISDAKFKIFGGVMDIVLADIMMDLIKDKKVEEALLVNQNDIFSKLGEDAGMKHSLVPLAVKATQNAVKDYRKRMLRLAIKNGINVKKL